MNLVTEILEEKTSVLIVAMKDFDFVRSLKLHLKANHANVYLSPTLPINLDRFDYCFLINFSTLPKKTFISKAKKISFIFLNNHNLALAATKLYANTRIKIVNLSGDLITKDQTDKILWFLFSETKENFLSLRIPKQPAKKDNSHSFAKLKFPKKRGLFFFILTLFLIFHIAFTGLLSISTYLFYQAAISFGQENLNKTTKLLDFGESIFAISKWFYLVPRTTLSIFSLSLVTDDIFAIGERTDLLLRSSITLQENTKQIVQLLFKKGKTSDEKLLLKLRINRLKQDVSLIEENVSIVSKKIPSSFGVFSNLKKDLIDLADLISRSKKLLPFLDSLFAKDTKKNYLLLFANNMELRPGGGFIGSFALLTVKDYTVEEIKVYDVYDADGQLIAHVEPPDAIRKYLNQPNWFLRDSAFSSDFLENYIQAKYFLEKEMGFKDFSGSVLLTTSAIQNILGAFADIYLPDFNEKVNQKNFYLKAQLYSEKEFFPGSIQKKNFLGSLTRYLLFNLENLSYQKFAKELKKSLDEKQIVLYFDDSKLQQALNSLYWSGRTIESSCPIKKDVCITDYIFPLDANLGVNKANFFVSRSFDLKVIIDETGKLHHTFSVQFKNDSLADRFPGGLYRNYFQLYLPQNTIIEKITKDGVLVEQYAEQNDPYKKIGVFLEIKPKTITELKIEYELEQKFSQGKNIYQLIAQKQIGASNSDFSARFILPKNINLLDQNFSALVKDNQIIYNTFLSTDKIFFIEMTKQ